MNSPPAPPDAGDAPAGADDPVGARQWLTRAVGDDAAMAVLRTNARGLNDGTDWSRLDDQQVLDQLAAALAAGRLPHMLPARPPQLFKLVQVLPPAPPPPPPPASSPPAAPAAAAAPAPAETTFGSELDVAAMVAALVQAAENGVPFCEECARAAAEAAA